VTFEWHRLRCRKCGSETIFFEHTRRCPLHPHDELVWLALGQEAPKPKQPPKPRQGELFG
jgi:hypothetical protein